MGIQPSEVWEMTLPELFAEIDTAEPAPKGPGLTDDDRARFTAWLDGGGE